MDLDMALGLQPRACRALLVWLHVLADEAHDLAELPVQKPMIQSGSNDTIVLTFCLSTQALDLQVHGIAANHRLSNRLC